MSDDTIRLLRQRITVRINEHKAKIDMTGRKLIERSLITSSEPYQTVKDIQDSYSLNFPRASPALSFLDVLQCSRSSVYQNLLENLKQRLESQLDSMTDDRNLLTMLDQTIAFLQSGDLKQVPISIIKRLPNIPERYLNYIAKKGHLMDFPFAVRRKAWEINLSLFDQTVDAHCRNCLSLSAATITDNRRADDSINQLCDSIGQSEKLFSAFADYCTLKAKEEAEPSWGRILRNVLTAIQGRPEKISSLGKLNDLSGLLGHCIRQGRVDAKQISTVVDTLKFFITAQYRLLLSVHDAECQRVAQLRAAYFAARKINVVAPKVAPKAINKPITKATATAAVSATSAPAPPSALKRGRDEKSKEVKPVEQEKNLSAKDIILMAKRVFMEAWKFVTSEDADGIFATKVTDQIAPEYSWRIKKPIDLSIIKMRIEQNYYRDMEQLSGDFKLMFDNCVQYNVDNFYAKLASKSWRKWESRKGGYTAKLGTIVKGPVPTSSASSSSFSSSSSSSSSSHGEGQGSKGRIAKSKASIVDDSDGDDDMFEGSLKKSKTSSSSSSSSSTDRKSSSSTSRPSPIPATATPDPDEPEAPPLTVTLHPDMGGKEALKLCLEAGWQYLADIDYSKTFHIAVTESMAPGYAKIISHPMDLSTMKLKIDRKMYKSLAAMDADVQQMYLNCIIFDEDSSGYSDYAKELTAMWDIARGQLEAALVSRKSIGVQEDKKVEEEKGAKEGKREEGEHKVKKADVKTEKVKDNDEKQVVNQEIKEEKRDNDEKDKKEELSLGGRTDKEHDVSAMTMQSEAEELFGAEDEEDKGQEDEYDRREKDEEDTREKDEDDRRGKDEEDKREKDDDDKREEDEDDKREEADIRRVEMNNEELKNETGKGDEEIRQEIKTERKHKVKEDTAGGSSSSSAMDVVPSGDGVTVKEEEAAPLLSSTFLPPVSSGGSDKHPPSTHPSRHLSDTAAPEAPMKILDLAVPNVPVAPAAAAAAAPLYAALSIASEAVPKPAPVPVHTGPPELPVESAILRQSCLADNYFKTQATVEGMLGGGKGGFSELPGVAAEGKLMWVLCILRDPQVQSLLVRFLASHLTEMLKPWKFDKKPFLPYEDPTCKFAIQLCQLSLSNEYELLELDQSLLRVEIPMMMFDVLCSSSSLEGVTSSEEESLEGIIAKSSAFKTHQDIARHAIEGASLCRNTQDPQGDLSLRLNFCETIAKLLLEFNGK